MTYGKWMVRRHEKIAISSMKHMKHKYRKADGEMNVWIEIRDVYWLSLGLADI